MNKLLIIFLLFFSSVNLSNAQSSSKDDFLKSYAVIEGMDKIDDFFINSFEKADWDRYRCLDKRRKLYFNENITVELLSANELKELGLSFNEGKIIRKGIDFDNKTIFVINSNGHIIEQKKSLNK
tara:strand:- start:565 stop:939 length:375 start_codon:yes stop_codon:yes gene_type:complete